MPAEKQNPIQKKEISETNEEMQQNDIESEKQKAMEYLENYRLRMAKE